MYASLEGGRVKKKTYEHEGGRDVCMCVHVEKQPPEVFYKKNFRNISQNSQENRPQASGLQLCFFLIGIHSMQGYTATTRHGVTRKGSTKRLKHTGNLFRKNLQLKDIC